MFGGKVTHSLSPKRPAEGRVGNLLQGGEPPLSWNTSSQERKKKNILGVDPGSILLSHSFFSKTGSHSPRVLGGFLFQKEGSVEGMEHGRKSPRILIYRGHASPPPPYFFKDS